MPESCARWTFKITEKWTKPHKVLEFTTRQRVVPDGLSKSLRNGPNLMRYWSLQLARELCQIDFPNLVEKWTIPHEVLDLTKPFGLLDLTKTFKELNFQTVRSKDFCLASV